MYESFFGLSAKPFQLNPDPDFFFGSRGHKRALAYLEYGLHQAEGFIVITGEVGAGKTTLLRGLLRRIQSQSIVPVQIVSTQVDSDDLLRLVGTAFGMPVEGLDKAALLTRLQSHFEGMHASGRRALLIVDEAQNLAPRAIEELRMLSNFQRGNQSLVQSFLVGQPEFREIMQRPEMRQLKQRVIASYHLGPLDTAESQQYVEHRLRHVGWKGDPGFDAAAYASIHEATGGVPRRINTLCDRLLLAAYLTDQHRIGAANVQSIVAELSAEIGGNGAVQDAYAEAARGQSAQTKPSTAAGDADLARIAARLKQLEERIESLEASTDLILSLVKKVLKIVRGAEAKESI